MSAAGEASGLRESCVLGTFGGYGSGTQIEFKPAFPEECVLLHRLRIILYSRDCPLPLLDMVNPPAAIWLNKTLRSQEFPIG